MTQDTPRLPPELLPLAEAWADAKAAMAYAGASRATDRNLDPDGRILEMAIDECRAAEAAFKSALANAAAAPAQAPAALDVEALAAELFACDWPNDSWEKHQNVGKVPGPDAAARRYIALANVAIARAYRSLEGGVR